MAFTHKLLNAKIDKHSTHHASILLAIHDGGKDVFTRPLVIR